jgi:ribose/xylose/arabinose/galactoside ABC-type transport system permease subunit
VNTTASPTGEAPPSLGMPRTSPLRDPATASLLAVGAVIIGAAVVFLLTTDGFASWGNVKAILAASSFVGILAVGQTGVMISGNFFSMSLGVQAAASALFFLWSLKYGLVPAFLLTFAFGAVISGIQGYAIGVWGASPIILTIASSALITGVVILITGGATVHPPADGPSIDFLGDHLGGIAVSAFVMVGVAVLAQFFLSRTRFGAMTYLVGANKAASRAAGLPVAKTVIVVFMLAGVCGAIAGIMLSGFQQTASLSLQGTLTFDAIAAVLVGGCSVLGGRGSAIATLVGTLGISAINSALILRDFSDGIQILVKGLVVLIAVVGVHLWTSQRR